MKFPYFLPYILWHFPYIFNVPNVAIPAVFSTVCLIHIRRVLCTAPLSAGRSHDSRPVRQHYLVRLPLPLVERVLSLGAGVEARKGGEGRAAGTAGGREGSHEVADGAQGGGDVWGERGVRQQVRHGAACILDEREVYATAAIEHTLQRGTQNRRQMTASRTSSRTIITLR